MPLPRILPLALIIQVAASGAAQAQAVEDIREHELGQALRYETVAGLTASGEPYNPDRLTLAHATLPFGTLVEVTFRSRQVVARVNDRLQGEGLVRLSARAADQLGLPPNGGIVELRLGADEVAFLREQAARRAAAAQRVHGSAKKPPSGEDGIVRYTVQMASFADEQRARAYAGKTRGTWVQPVSSGSGTVYRVYYGVYPSRESAGRALEALHAQGLSGFVKGIREEGPTPAV